MVILQAARPAYVRLRDALAAIGMVVVGVVPAAATAVAMTALYSTPEESHTGIRRGASPRWTYNVVRFLIVLNSGSDHSEPGTTSTGRG
jgi:hypothetical protein